MKIRELLSDESKWCKGAIARAVSGFEVKPESEDAVCWCIGGAFELCYKHNREEARSTLDKLVKETGDMLHAWNDAPERTFKEVKELVDRLDV